MSSFVMLPSYASQVQVSLWLQLTLYATYILLVGPHADPASGILAGSYVVRRLPNVAVRKQDQWVLYTADERCLSISMTAKQICNN